LAHLHPNGVFSLTAPTLSTVRTRTDTGKCLAQPSATPIWRPGAVYLRPSALYNCCASLPPFGLRSSRSHAPRAAGNWSPVAGGLGGRCCQPLSRRYCATCLHGCSSWCSVSERMSFLASHSGCLSVRVDPASLQAAALLRLHRSARATSFLSRSTSFAVSAMRRNFAACFLRTTIIVSFMTSTPWRRLGTLQRKRHNRPQVSRE
jgi:hypothetical protein